MFTQEQKDRKLKTAQAAVDDAKARRDRYQERQKAAQAEYETALQTLEWVKTMPVNGTQPATPAQADSA